MTNELLIHYHIFKNAGSSVDAMLKRNFQDRWTNFEGNSSTDVQSSDKLANFISENRNFRAISSHLARPPLPTANSHAILFLRDPILRARSVYSFVKQSPDQDGYAHCQNGFASYVKWALDSVDGGVVIRDYQTIHLSSASFRGPIHLASASDFDLEEAKTTIELLGGTGIVEYYARSMEFYQTRLGIAFPECDFTVEHENKSENGNIWTHDQIADALGQPLFERLLDANRRDQKLYEHALTALLAAAN